MAGTKQLHQLLIGAQPEQWRPDRDPMGQSDPCLEG